METQRLKGRLLILNSERWTVFRRLARICLDKQFSKSYKNTNDFS